MILITGWTGNTGSLVLKKLLEQYNSQEIIGITREQNNSNPEGIIVEKSSLENKEDVENIFKKYKIKTIIHIANIRYSPLILELANKYRIHKVILIHTTGIYSKYRAYSKLYHEIEDDILSNQYPCTNYIILRPTMIYGNDRDHNMHKLIKFLNKYPFFPVFGNGEALMQPVHVEDLANIIIKAHNEDNLKNKDYDISGGSVVSYKEVLELITNELGKKVYFIYIPIKLAIFGSKLISKFMAKPIVSIEQVRRLQEDKSYSHEKAKVDLEYTPRTFAIGIVEEVRSLKEKGVI
ncbi:NAD-dependent epimerase/dehydratase family protein [Bacillus fungorum]|uniref:NAD-dependent epimerase/dehydratase family protein n=1 Tax=Bacillus fungorum TaxID=2039284 RepID=UPI003395B9BD